MYDTAGDICVVTVALRTWLFLLSWFSATVMNPIPTHLQRGLGSSKCLRLEMHVPTNRPNGQPASIMLRSCLGVSIIVSTARFALMGPRRVMIHEENRPGVGVSRDMRDHRRLAEISPDYHDIVSHR